MICLVEAICQAFGGYGLLSKRMRAIGARLQGLDCPVVLQGLHHVLSSRVLSEGRSGMYDISIALIFVPQLPELFLVCRWLGVLTLSRSADQIICHRILILPEDLLVLLEAEQANLLSVQNVLLLHHLHQHGVLADHAQDFSLSL